MSANEILTQDEIDALLHGVESGDVETKADAEAPAAEVIEYDFTGQDRIVRARFPALDILNQRFARQLRISLFDMLKRVVEVSAGAVQMIKFSEYAQSLYVPASLNLVHIRPLKGTALFVLDPKLVFTIVENFFGGDGRFHTKLEGREFTPTELRVIKLLLDMIFRDVKDAWAPVLGIDVEFMNMEINPHFATIVSPDEVVVVCPFHVESEGGSGDIHVTMPYAMVEPIRELLEAPIQGDREGTDEAFQIAFRNGLMQADVELSGHLAETRLTMRALNRLSPGDVIPIELPRVITIYAEGVPLLRGAFGQSEGKNAVKIVELIGNPSGGDLAVMTGVGR
jgi:flagellar motor switch protein FliM